MFFQYNVYIDEIRSILGPLKAFGIPEEMLFNSLSHTIEDHNIAMKLGEFVRNFYDGIKHMDDDNDNEINKI